MPLKAPPAFQHRGYCMAKKRARISDGATFEELQAFLFKLARQLRSLEPPSQDLGMLEWIKMLPGRPGPMNFRSFWCQITTDSAYK
jgi:hypothetical protein